MSRRWKWTLIAFCALCILIVAILLFFTMVYDPSHGQQNELETRLSAVYSDSAASDEEIVRTVVELYFEITAEAYTGNRTLDNHFLLSSDSSYEACHAYFNQQAARMFPNPIYDFQYRLTIESIELSGDTGTVTAEFMITYRYPELDHSSGMNILYTLGLERTEGRWLIGDIQTNSSEDAAARSAGYKQ